MNKNFSAHRRGVKGFTLIELLVSVAIIGFMSVAGSTTYQFVRARARDVRRVSDMNAIRSAIETYFEQHGAYPVAPREGLVFGSEGAKMISDAGITPNGGQLGIVYLQNAPFNVLPHGVPYVYRSLNKDGTLCERDCVRYEVTFALETPTGSLSDGPHLLTDAGFIGGESGASGLSTFVDLVKYLPSAEEINAAFGSAEELAQLARERAKKNDVQTTNAFVVLPASIVSALAAFSAAASTAMPFGDVGRLLLVLLTQPFAFLSRRKRQRWGVVYHAGTKVPIDLATVRLIDAKTNRVVATKVTDKDGRFAFIPGAGEYRLEAVKPGFRFPAASIETLSDDGAFSDIYHGTLLRAEGGRQALTVNIPLDPEEDPLVDAKTLLSVRNKKTLRKTIAALGPLFGALALIIAPNLKMLLLFLAQLFVYQFFMRLAEPSTPTSYGVVCDIDTRKPIAGAIIRVLSLPYHKVLETKLTDAQGRYAFNVGAGVYYLTVTKPGYEKTETDEIDFTKIDKPAWIGSDLPMRRATKIPR